MGCIKKAIGGRTIAEAKANIVALNHSQPYNNKTLTPFEAMTGLVSPVNGIPMTEQGYTELISRDWITKKKNMKESPLSTYPGNRGTSSQDKYTQEEREISKHWIEKIHDNPTKNLTCGDRVYYIDPSSKGFGRWRTCILLQRKPDYQYHDGIHRAHGYNIYDVENCTTVSRTRTDIRKFKHTKAE